MELVLDASPLIFLARIDGLGLLNRLAGNVVFPAAVLEEVRAGRERRTGAIDVAALPRWLAIERDVPVPPEIAAWDLGAGESQVLALTLSKQGAEAVLDDLQARRCARSLGLATAGTLGIVLRAKKAGLIPAARPLVEQLLATGLYLTRDLVQAALAEVGDEGLARLPGACSPGSDTSRVCATVSRTSPGSRSPPPSSRTLSPTI